MRITRRQSLAVLAGSAGMLATGPGGLVRAASGLAATPAVAPGLTLASGLDMRSPAALAFLREMGVKTASISPAGAPAGAAIANEPQFAPVPAIAHGPTIPAAGYLVGEIRG